MKFLLALLFIIVTAAGSHAQTTNENAILDVLKKQTAAWNRGDLDAFMIGYWQNDSLLFIGKSGITYGYQKHWRTIKEDMAIRPAWVRLPQPFCI